MDRNSFYSWAWNLKGLVGIHEGTSLAEGFTVDSAEAPPERDWIEAAELAEGEFYFSTREEAVLALERLQELQGLEVGNVQELVPQDWDAQWKASFQGTCVPPFWEVLPPWVAPSPEAIASRQKILRINPGSGFGTGTHETTRLCLQAIGELSRGRSLAKKTLDFGSGSGILSIAAALLGAEVDGVEVDPLAIDNATENAALNSVSERVRFHKKLGSGMEGPYGIVLANILKPVLLEFSDELAKRLSPSGTLILSGLLEKDIESVSERYFALLQRQPEVRALGEWRALIWQLSNP